MRPSLDSCNLSSPVQTAALLFLAFLFLGGATWATASPPPGPSVGASAVHPGYLWPPYACPNPACSSSAQSPPFGRNATIQGTFKVLESKVLATNVTKDGMAYTISMVTVGRNESTSPRSITGVITFEAVRQVDTKTGNGTLFGVGTFVGTIAGVGPGECTYRISSVLTGQGTSHASSVAKHWIADCTGGLSGVTEVSTSIGSAVFTAKVQLDPPLATQSQHQGYAYRHAL